MGPVRAWLQSWRSGIRLGETAVVIGLWAGAVTASDPVIAQILFLLGFLVGAIAILADTNTSRKSAVGLVILLAVVCLVAEAIYIWRHEASALSPLPIPPAGASREDIAKIVADALKNNRPMVQERVVSKSESPVYRIIVKSEPEAEAPRQPTPKESAAELDRVRRLVNRSRAVSGGYARCLNKIVDVSTALNKLVTSAINVQNEYANGWGTKRLLAGSAAWDREVRAVFEKYKDDLPDVETVLKVTPSKPTKTFLGINHNGIQAWSVMEAKRDVNDGLSKQVSNRSCAHASDEDLAKCTSEGTC